MGRALKTAAISIAATAALFALVAPIAIRADASIPVVLRMRVTAYSSLPDETDSTPFITADGTRVHDGIVATNLLPFGTEIQIPSLFGSKIFTVDDRMSPKIKDTIDIWMQTKAAAIYFGAHEANILIYPVAPSSAAPQAS